MEPKVNATLVGTGRAVASLTCSFPPSVDEFFSSDEDFERGESAAVQDAAAGNVSAARTRSASAMRKLSKAAGYLGIAIFLTGNHEQAGSAQHSAMTTWQSPSRSTRVFCPRAAWKPATRRGPSCTGSRGLALFHSFFWGFQLNFC